jgi:hypothetical protein
MFVVGAALACALPVSAQTSPATPGGQPNAAQFAQHKQNELNRIQARIQIEQTLQLCVQAATNHAGMHTCNETARQSMQALHKGGD